MEKTTGAKRTPMASWERLGQRGRLLQTVRWVSFLPGIFFTFFNPFLFFLRLLEALVWTHNPVVRHVLQCP